MLGYIHPAETYTNYGPWPFYCCKTHEDGSLLCPNLLIMSGKKQCKLGGLESCGFSYLCRQPSISENDESRSSTAATGSMMMSIATETVAELGPSSSLQIDHPVAVNIASESDESDADRHQETLNLIGRYELPLRGDGEVKTCALNEPKLNEGVLRAILGLMGQVGDPRVKEVFIEFQELTSTTGREVADSLLDSLKMYNLNINEIIAQGYDCAPNMSSGDKGVHGGIKEIVPAHRLNLVATDAATGLSIAQTLSCIKECKMSKYSEKISRGIRARKQKRTLDMAKFQRNHLSLPPRRPYPILTRAKTTAMMQQQLDDVGQQIEQQRLELEPLQQA
uniref:DUF4371 domain-containing protein n=1 Tax=Romanomermis culicivorax TaxID=13658 RepID=A0A915HFJ7_ROMCU